MQFLGIHKHSQQLKLWNQKRENFPEGLGSDSDDVPPPQQHTHTNQQPELTSRSLHRPIGPHIILHVQKQKLHDMSKGPTLPLGKVDGSKILSTIIIL